MDTRSAGSEPVDLARLIADRQLDDVDAQLSRGPVVRVAADLSRLSDEDLALCFRLLQRDRALAVFELLDTADQQRLVTGMRSDAVRGLVADLGADDRARLIDELPASVARRVLVGLSPAARAETAELLGYPPESAGRIMTPAVVRLRSAMTVGDALTAVRVRGTEAETIYTLPVTDDERHLQGVVELQRLFLSDDDQRVADVMEADPLRALATDDQEDGARLIQEADLLALPVVDSEDRLLGLITVDDAMEVIEAEETEDRALQGAASPLGRPYLAVTVRGLARARAPWLLILVVAAILTVNVLQVFEATLEEVVSLAVFIPLLIGTGGNTGAQAASTVIRAMAVGEVRFSDLARVAWHEARAGLLLGFMLGVAGFLPVALVFGADLAIVIAVTLVAICTWAALVGSVLPMFARRVGVDPAVVSAPLVTTLVDATGLLIYLLVARVVLGI